jgi:hypothetical protein
MPARINRELMNKSGGINNTASFEKIQLIAASMVTNISHKSALAAFDNDTSYP